MNVGREVGEVISINTQTLSWASKSFSNSLFSFFTADCLSPSVSFKCPFHCYTYHHVAVVCVVGCNFFGSLKKCPRELLVVFFFQIAILMK